jgi:hypothetical protein
VTVILHLKAFRTRRLHAALKGYGRTLGIMASSR